jgi:hypothetical protein
MHAWQVFRVRSPETPPSQSGALKLLDFADLIGVRAAGASDTTKRA